MLGSFMGSEENERWGFLMICNFCSKESEKPCLNVQAIEEAAVAGNLDCLDYILSGPDIRYIRSVVTSYISSIRCQHKNKLAAMVASELPANNVDPLLLSSGSVGTDQWLELLEAVQEIARKYDDFEQPDPGCSTEYNQARLRVYNALIAFDQHYEKTKPPLNKQRLQYHWLGSERALTPCLSEWLKDAWYSAGEAGPITPEEMYRRGWRYLRPVDLPPEFEGK